MRLLQSLALVACLLLSVNPLTAGNYSHPEIDRLLQSAEAPTGVVIEVISWDPNTWDWATPMIRQFREQLDQRFPGIDVAVVSHGAEQFLLTRDNLANTPAVLDGLTDLADQGVDFHVCGTHSEWRGVDESEYADLVNVSASGPAQINDYKNLGYQLVILRNP